VEDGVHAVRGELEGLRPLRSLGREDLETLARLGTSVRNDRERVLAYQGEEADRVFLVLRGAVRLLKYRSDDTCIVLSEVERGNWVGLTEALLACPFLVDAAAVPGTHVLSFSPDSLHRIRGRPAIQDHLLDCMARSTYRLHLRIEENLPLPRLVRFLLEHATPQGGTSAIDATQDQIAEAIGVTRETVNRYLRRLQDEGLIRVGRGTVELSRPEELERRLLI